jgi:hypothetical protein
MVERGVWWNWLKADFPEMGETTPADTSQKISRKSAKEDSFGGIAGDRFLSYQSLCFWIMLRLLREMLMKKDGASVLEYI